MLNPINCVKFEMLVLYANVNLLELGRRPFGASGPFTSILSTLSNALCLV